MLHVMLLLGLLSADPRLEALWHEGTGYDAFYEDVDARRALWQTNTRRAATALPADLVQRAQAVPGTWRLLIIAAPGCSDSANLLPYVAAFGDRAGLPVRIVTPEQGEQIMDAHRTPDGRAATPTVVLLDERFDKAGVWVERPVELQTMLTQNPDGLSDTALFDAKMAWYQRDGGRSALAEIVALLEAAAVR